MYFWEEQSINSIHSAQQPSEMEQNKEQYFDPKVLNQFIKATNETLQRQDKEIVSINSEINKQNEMISIQQKEHESELTETKKYNNRMMLIAIASICIAIGSLIVAIVK